MNLPPSINSPTHFDRLNCNSTENKTFKSFIQNIENIQEDDTEVTVKSAAETYPEDNELLYRQIQDAFCYGRTPYHSTSSSLCYSDAWGSSTAGDLSPVYEEDEQLAESRKVSTIAVHTFGAPSENAQGSIETVDVSDGKPKRSGGFRNMFRRLFGRSSTHKNATKIN